MKHDGPTLVEVFVNRYELSIPPSITIEQAKGFSLWVLRAVLNGRGDALLDLANTHTLREVFNVGKSESWAESEKKPLISIITLCC